MGGGVRVEGAQRTLLDALDAGAPPLDAWRAYRRAHADVLDYYEEAFGAPQEPEAQLAVSIAEQAVTLRRRECVLALDELAPRVAQMLEVAPDAVEAVTFVAWGRAIAWCDDEHTDPRAYFALERMPDDPILCRAIGAHELTHLAHIRAREGDWPPWWVLGGIVAEAVAIDVSRRLVPEADPAAVMFVQPESLSAYARERDAVHAELLGLLDVVDEATYRRAMFPATLCGGDVAGVNECGYAVADELIAAWRAAGLSPAQAARRTPDEARADLVALLSR